MSIINKIKYRINSVDDELYTIIGGEIPIYNLYENKNEYIKDSKVYKKYNIYFLDQLISTNGTHLLMWTDLKYRKLYKKISRIPKIYNIIKEKTCKERSNELQDKWKINYNSFNTGLEIINKDKRYKEFILIIDKNSEVVFRKVVKK